MNNHGSFLDIFTFIVMAVTFILISVIFVYIGNEVYQKLKVEMPKVDVSISSENKGINVTKTMEESIGPVNQSYSILIWGCLLIIIFMIVAIWIGSYMVVSRPVYFIPYIFICIIAIMVSAGISNAYESLTLNESLASTFTRFSASNFIMSHLAFWVSIISIVGGIIMYVRMQRGEEEYYYG